MIIFSFSNSTKEILDKELNPIETTSIQIENILNRNEIVDVSYEKLTETDQLKKILTVNGSIKDIEYIIKYSMTVYNEDVI